MNELTSSITANMTASTCQFFSDKLKKDKNVLLDNAKLAANCMVLANYDTACLENYYTDQIKVDWKQRLLIDTSSFDITQVFSKYIGGWSEPYTDLDKTVELLKEVCEKIFKRAHGYGCYLSKLPNKPKDQVETYEKLTTIALFVFSGLVRMKNSYTKHYKSIGEQKKGYKELLELKTQVDTWGKSLSELFCSTIAPPCSLEYSHNNSLLAYIGLSDENSVYTHHAVDLDDVNIHLMRDQWYYESLCNLCHYDVKDSCDYRNNQIKAIEKTKLLVLTGTWSLNNWGGVLTPLNQTVVLLEQHCERAKKDCEEIFSYLAKSEATPADLKLQLVEEANYIIEHALPGIKRMANTYNKYYANDPKHPGLQALNNCVKGLWWMNHLKPNV
jgi:hypothetical protein